MFQEVREKRGLVYSVYSYSQQFLDSGMVGVYAGCGPARLDAVRETVTMVLDDVATNGITAAELEKAKGQLAGGMVLGLEDTGSRMSRIAKAELTTGDVPSVSQVLDRVQAVTLEEVNALAHHLWSQERLTTIVGPE